MTQFIIDPIQIRRDTILEVIRERGAQGLKKDEIAPFLKKLLLKKQIQFASKSDYYITTNHAKIGTSAKTIDRDLNLFKQTGFIEVSKKIYRVTQKGKQHSSAYFSNALTDAEMDPRFIYDERSKNYIFETSQYEILEKVKSAIIRGVKLSFVYDKTSGQSERKVEPIGVVQERGCFKLIALKSPSPSAKNETLVDRLRAYVFPKISEVNVLYESSIFSQYSNDDAVKWLHSGISEYKVTEEYERVTLKLSKVAALDFSCAQIKGSRSWQFKWLNQPERLAEVAFSCQPSISIVSIILSYGKHIKVEEGEILKPLILNNCN